MITRLGTWWYRDSWPWPLWQGGVHQLPAGSRNVLLTFDDGPTADSLGMARLLAERNLRALFFLVGSEAACHSSLVGELAALGQSIGSHGLHHLCHARRAPAQVTRELLEARDILQQASAQPVRWLRPPYGSWAPWLHTCARRAGQCCLFWSLNPKDHAAPDGAVIAERVIRHARRGDILLLHCSGRGARQTREALPLLLDGLERTGLGIADPGVLDSPGADPGGA